MRLKHPEGLVVAADGAIWCGGDGGEIYRIASDASGIELSASTGGFTLGMAFDSQGWLFASDLGIRAVYRLDPRTHELEQFSTGGGAMRVPNHPVVDTARSCRYVSDSYGFGQPVIGFPTLS